MAIAPFTITLIIKCKNYWQNFACLLSLVSILCYQIHKNECINFKGYFSASCVILFTKSLLTKSSLVLLRNAISFLHTIEMLPSLVILYRSCTVCERNGNIYYKIIDHVWILKLGQMMTTGVLKFSFEADISGT